MWVGVGDCPVHCGMFDSIPGLYPRNASSIPSPSRHPKISPDIVKCPLGNVKLSMVENPWSICSGDIWMYIDSSRCVAFTQNLTLISKLTVNCHQSPWNKTTWSNQYHQKRGVWFSQKLKVIHLTRGKFLKIYTHKNPSKLNYRLKSVKWAHMYSSKKKKWRKKYCNYLHTPEMWSFKRLLNVGFFFPSEVAGSYYLLNCHLVTQKKTTVI